MGDNNVFLDISIRIESYTINRDVSRPRPIDR